MDDETIRSQRLAEKVELSIQLDSDLLDQLKHLTNDPSRIVETAIKQWLRGERERDDDLTRTFHRNPPVPLRGEWND
ncbi:MAG: type II toxin-antitoxin system CcdA family antitoxin [Spirulinaceae cyanobacterium RM2_2_10]|nr:type II toxin-antitoxin system CcdA family antitoxin [Spirulinaceae cyanobacterium SM2_1_0]NJO20680.1 type II toxin-antitoxin system CcdA family antitoxin [Spirulinaceae cyanobacterium RM2_2_10]